MSDLDILRVLHTLARAAIIVVLIGLQRVPSCATASNTAPMLFMAGAYQLHHHATVPSRNSDGVSYRKSIETSSLGFVNIVYHWHPFRNSHVRQLTRRECVRADDVRRTWLARVRV